MTARQRACCGLALLITGGAPLAAQSGPSVTPSFGSEWVRANQPIELTLNEVAAKADGRIAVFIGTTDYSAVFDRKGDRLVYRFRHAPLPTGEQEVTVYAVASDQQWQEIGRLPLRVLSPEGFENVDLTPRLALSNKGQIAEGHAPIENAPQRAEYQDYALNTGFQTRHVRSGWSVRTQANFAGASNRQEALRFGELQGEAPKFDLSDYLVTVERGAAVLSAGHVAFGQNRHLLNGFASRGITTALRLGSIAQVSAAALNGNSIVGWTNPFGLSNANHRVLAGNFGLEVVPGKPGLIHLDGLVLGGSMLPRSGFTQGAITDAEKSVGGGVHLTAADPSQRIRIDAGYSRSSFTNPLDAELASGASIVPVARVARYARYLDASINVLRGTKLIFPTNLALSLQHERVDPLYRNVASPVTADVLNNTVSAQANVGALALQASYARTNDNLDEIASILTTRTRTSSANAALPLTSIFRKASWLPTISAGVQRLHQFGEGVPPNSDFSESHVPDQVSVTQNIAVQWQRDRWSAGYQRNQSDQDNRQVGRELADFVNATNVVTLSLSLLRSLDVGLDVGFDDANSKEQSQKNRTRRMGGTINWRATTTTALAVSFARTTIEDDPLTSEQTATDLRAELSQRFPLLRLTSASSPGQLFVRFARQSGDLFSPFMAKTSRRNWNVNTGLTIGLL